MSDIASSLQYLLACSEASLESFELSRLNRASNLRKELSQVAEEWVEAEVSSRLARLIVERRRADTHSTEPQSPRSAMLKSPGALILRLPFPYEPDDADIKRTDVKGELVAAHSQAPRKRAKSEERASDCSAGPASGSKRKIPATKKVGVSKAGVFFLPPTNMLVAAPGIARARAARVAKSLQAATELKALDVIASGPPEMHSNLPLRKIPPVLFLRPGARFASSQLPRSAMERRSQAWSAHSCGSITTRSAHSMSASDRVQFMLADSASHRHPDPVLRDIRHIRSKRRSILTTTRQPCLAIVAASRFIAACAQLVSRAVAQSPARAARLGPICPGTQIIALSA